tara:strand:+ start:48 stop:296 length:249 start_codon:yes stop_codon:yes gene_type:complete
MRGVYSDDHNTTGQMLAFGATDEECLSKLWEIGGDYDPSADDSLRYCDVTAALVEASGEYWRFLPGTNVAATRDEVDAVYDA